MPESYDPVQITAAALVALVAVAVLVRALAPIYMPVWHLFVRTQQFLEDWFGEPADERRGVKARPGAMARLAQLENNGGSSFRDKVEAQAQALANLQHDVTNIRAGQDLLLGQVDSASSAAARAAERAEETARQVESVGDRAHRERLDIQSALAEGLEDLEERMAVRSAEKTADWLEILAENGGPDLRGHLPPVAPHAHELPQRHDPTLTGGPVDPVDGP